MKTATRAAIILCILVALLTASMIAMACEQEPTGWCAPDPWHPDDCPTPAQPLSPEAPR